MKIIFKALTAELSSLWRIQLRRLWKILGETYWKHIGTTMVESRRTNPRAPNNRNSMFQSGCKAMSKPATVHVFLDANTALHFKRPDQVDWLKLTGACEVVLVAAPILLSELEEQKIINNSKKLRDRAGKYIKWLNRFVDAPGTEVRSKITWMFLTNEPQIDFGAERLSETVSDDQLIANVLCYSRQSGSRPIVATADIGLKVKLKSRNIKVLVLPDDLRLPVEPDPIERENKQLRNKITRLESRIPRLSMTFEDGAEYHTLRIRDPNFTDVKSLERIKAEHPHMTTAAEAGLCPPVSSMHAIEKTIRGENRLNFNTRLEKFFRDYQTFLNSHAAWLEAFCMHHLIKLVIANDGTAPASNVDVELYFPEGVVPVEEDDIPERPKPPDAPKQEEGLIIQNVRGFEDFDVVGRALEGSKKFTKHLHGGPDIDLKENAIYIGYLQLKHGFTRVSDPLIFRFVSKDTVGAFQINYRLSADELPDALEGDLHIRIDEDSKS